MSRQLSVNLGLPANPQTSDKALYGELQYLYNALNALASAVDIYTGAISRNSDDWSALTPMDTIQSGGPNRLYVKFQETVAAGGMVNLVANGTAVEAVIAKARTTIKAARGFCSNGGVTAGNYGEVILFGLNASLSGLTPGTVYYLSPTSTTGQITSTVPTTVGDLKQEVGFALSDTMLFFCPTLRLQVL